MKTQNHSNQDSYKIETQEENKQEIIHEDDKEDQYEESDDNDDLDEVFGHKTAIRNKVVTGNTSKHHKKGSMSDLKVNVEGPIKFNSSANNSVTIQRVPQSATQPAIKGLAFPQPNTNQKNIGQINQLYSPTYPPLHNSFGKQGMQAAGGIQMNQGPIPQMMHQSHIPLYPMHPMYASQQPQSAGLSRKPPGFEFMNPKPMQPNYAEYTPQYNMPPQNPYYMNKQSVSPMIPPTSGYDMAMLKKQPQSATMNLPRGEENDASLNFGIKGKATKLSTVSSVDAQESVIYEFIKECEKAESFEDKLDSLRGKLCEMLFTQTGSRFIQKQLSEDNDEGSTSIEEMRAKNEENRIMIHNFTTFILEEIGEKVNELMIDRYGNYFFQELIRKCDEKQRLNILQNIKNSFIQICTDKKGTHTVQRLIDMVSSIEEEKAMQECIKGQVYKLCMDAQGTHVMQKYVKVFPEKKREFVIDELLENELIIKVSKNSYGLAVMKKVIKFTENFETRRRIINVISKYTSSLVQDPYGNYVLQESLDNWHDTDPELIDDNDNCFFAGVFKNIEGKIERLAIQKFSSNVIEKCLERSNEYYRGKFIKEIIEGESVSIMKNSYGNYVFQKSLALAKGIDKFKIIDVIFKNFPSIQDQKIKMKWIKLLKKNIKQEDVLEADAEQDSLNLEIDQMVNYSHKFKLINDELSRFDSNQSKKDKLKQSTKKKAGTGYEQNAHESYSAGIYNPHSQPYQGKIGYGGADPSMKMVSPMYPSGAPGMIKGKQFESIKSQYQPAIIPQTFLPPPPMGYMPQIPQYQYHPMSAGVPMMAPPMNDMSKMEYVEGFYGVPPNMMNQDEIEFGYHGVRDNQ